MIDFFKRERKCKKGLKYKMVELSEYNKSVSKLTPSETRVYVELVKGYNSREIAKRLRLKKSTIDSYLKIIYKKLNVHSIVELIMKYGITFNYIDGIESMDK